MKSQLRFSRRAFLEGLGLSAAFLPLVGPDRALAAPGGTPKRVLFIAWTNGYEMDDWRPKGGETDFTFGETLKPLQPFRDKVIVIDGVGQKVQYEAKPSEVGWAKDQYYGGHDAYTAVLTGVPLSKYADFLQWSGGDSLDWHISKEIAKQVKLPFDNLVLAPQGESDYGGTISYKGKSAGVTPEKEPLTLYTKLFSGGAVAPEQLAKTIAVRRSVLDHLGKSLTSFGRRLGGDDKLRVEAHLESIRALEKQLDNTPTSGDPAAACGVAPVTAKINAEKDLPKSLQTFSDLVVSAFSCDLVRTASILYSNCGGDNIVFSWLGNEFVGKGDEYPTRQHHDITHNAGRSADHKRRKIRVDQWFYEQVAYTAKKLQDTKDASGAPLLDNTLIVVTNAMGYNHDSKLQPFVLVGNLGGYFKTGRSLKYSNEAHNKVLVSIASAMDVDASAWSAKQYATELARLRA